jgi:hypothetical protein
MRHAALALGLALPWLHAIVGAVVNFSPVHHLLLSSGPSFGTDAREQVYLAYQLTL